MKGPVSRNPVLVAARVLDAAQAEFMEHGYDSASTNRIVRRFGGSKATLFRYFPSKQALLEAVVRRVAAQWREAVDFGSIPAFSPSAWLETFARRTLNWILGEGPLFVGRLAIAEGRKLPALERIFRNTAGRPLIAVISSQLRHWNRSGHLASRKPDRDAVRFLDLLVAGMVSRRLYGEASPSAARLEAHIQGGVALFLHGCAAAPPNRRAAGSSAPRRRHLSR